MVGRTEDAKDIFDILDRERSGGIDIKELGRGLRALGLNPTEDEVQNLIREAQQNSAGKMTLEEFQRLANKCRTTSVTNVDDVRKFFESFDTNKDGFASTAELKAALTSSGEVLEDSEVEAVLKDFVKSETGKVNIKELLEGLFKPNQ